MVKKTIPYFIAFIILINGKILLSNDLKSDSLKIQYFKAKSDSCRLSNTDSAILYLNQALQLAKNLKNEYEIASCQNTIGLLFKTKGEYNNALIYLHKALEIREQLGDSLLIGSSYENIGNIHKKRGKCDTALIYYRKSQKIKEKANIPEYLGGLYNGIASIYKCLEIMDSSLSYYNLSQNIYTELKDTLKLAKTYNNIGNIFSMLNKNEKAKANFLQALKYYQLTGSLLGTAELHNNIATVYYYENKPDSAIKYYLLSIEYFKQTNSREYLQIVFESLSDAYIQMGDFAKAYEHFQISVLYKDSIFNENSLRIIEELETKYQTEKKEQALKLSRESEALTRVENNLIKAENKMKETTIYILVGSIIIILIIAFFILRIYWQKKELAKKELALRDQRINRLLKEQELKSYSAMLEGQDAERKRIAEDLHDRLGSVLSTVKLHFQSMDSKIEELKVHNLDQYQKANELLDQAVTEVREIAHNLASGVLVKFGLEAALHDLKESIESGSQLKVNLYFSGLEGRLNANTEIELYRIIQELFSNVLRHAKAEAVHLQLNRQNGNLNIIFEDNGKGFDHEKVNRGMGLKNIQSRIAKLNGEVNIDSTKDKGTTIVIDIPVNHD